MLSEGSLIARGVCTWTEVLGWKGETGRRLWQKFSQEVTRVWSKRVAMAMRRKGLWEVEFQDLSIDCTSG